MATIRQAKSGLWQAIVRRKGFPQQSTTFVKFDDATKWARNIENKIDRGMFIDRSEAEATTLYDALDRYSHEVTPGKKGCARELGRIKTWQTDPLAKRSVATLQGSDFAKWRDNRLKEVKPATIRNDLALISNLFTVASKEWGLPVQNPIKNIRLPSATGNGRSRRLEDDEETRLFTALANSGKGDLANPWTLPMAQIAIETAMRLGELLSLHWSQVNLADTFIHLPDTKNEETRDVPLSKHAVTILKAMPRSITGRVFPTTDGAVRQSFKRACIRAGIVGLRFHDLRHEATTRLANNLALHELMKVTGHKSSQMLERYYHPRAKDLAKKIG